MIKIAYLMRIRPDLDDIIPADVEGVRVQVGDDGLYTPEDLARVADADAFVISMEPVNEQILAATRKLKIVQRLGVGYETLDLAACAKRGIPACNIEGVNKEAVAEHTLMLILALAKQMLPSMEATRRADWLAARKLTNRAFDLHGKKLGIVGFGNTGSELARRAHAFGMQISYSEVRDVNADLARQLGAKRVETAQVLAQSDVIAICTDLNATSRNLIDAEAIATIQPHAIFTCCARGGIVDEAALAKALDEERIAAAGIDVFGIEPVRPENPLLTARNCIVTAHVAGVTGDSTRRTWEWAHDNIRAVVLRGEKPRWVRNGV